MGAKMGFKIGVKMGMSVCLNGSQMKATRILSRACFSTTGPHSEF